MKTEKNPIKILFVCMGNICRSPSAEAVMNACIVQYGLLGKIVCDSAGTIAYHAGEPADSRMQVHANQRNYRLTSISRQIKSGDFESFDYIIGMDDDNLKDMKSFLPFPNLTGKISKMTDYCSNNNPGHVPDPYYGGADGFEQVLDLLEDACAGLLNKIKDEHQF